MVKRDLCSSMGGAFAAWREACCWMYAVYKLCGTTSPWVTHACTVVGPLASPGEEQSYNIQTAQVKQCVKNNENSPCAFHTIFYDF